MKKSMRRTLALVLAFALCLSVAALAVEQRDGTYIKNKYATAKSGNGITVEFTVIAFSTMTDLGATKVEIKTASGTTVKTYNYTDAGYSDLMGHNCSSYKMTVSYPGVPGNQYYAVAYLKAVNSEGYAVTTCTSDLVTTVRSS